MSALHGIPDGLRIPLLTEYQSISQNYAEHRWSPAELSGGRFCEIVFTILSGHAQGKYASKPSKPNNFVAECRKLEQNNRVPRSFQILIPRLLPALYEVRNNRGVGHTDGDVDPNHMDATFVMTSCNWIMAEMVRVFHNLTTNEAQAIADNLVERRVPLIWEGDNVRRILDPNMKLRPQILVLLSTSSGSVSIDDLVGWTDTKNKAYFLKILKKLHNDRKIELSKDCKSVHILPPGSNEAAALMKQKVPV